MRSGITSLLRRITHASSRAVLLGSVALALVSPAAAAAAAPDPSPVGAGGAAQPDPYHAPAPPAVQRPRPVIVIRPAPIVIAPVAPRPRTVTVVKKAVVKKTAHRHRATAHVKRRHAKPAVALAPAATFAPVVRRIPPLVSQVVSEVRSGSAISPGLAFAVAGLVLLSGALLAGAARQVAR